MEQKLKFLVKYSCVLSIFVERAWILGKKNPWLSIRSIFNPSRPDPREREKINFNLYFHTSIRCKETAMHLIWSFL